MLDSSEKLSNQAQAHLESLGQLSGRLAHDFGNVLEAIHANLEVLLFDPNLSLSDENRACLNDALQACSLGATLSHHLLGYVRKQSYEATRLVLSELLLDVVNLASHCLDKRYEFIVDERLIEKQVSIYGSYSILGHGILTILQRAAESMPDGGQISIQVEKDNNYAYIYVLDQGTHLPEHDLNFNTEHSSDSSTHSNTHKGNLSVIKTLLEKTGGSLSVRRNEKGGNAVIFCLPLSNEKAPSHNTPPALGIKVPESKKKENQETSPNVSTTLVRKTQLIDFQKLIKSRETQPASIPNTVCVVDDDPLVRRGVSRSLSTLGLEVSHQFPSGIELLETLKEMPMDQWPGWLLTDYAMPELNGIEIIHTIQNWLNESHETPAPMKFILMSAYPPEDIEESFPAQEKIDYHVLTKPFGIETLRELILRFSDHCESSSFLDDEHSKRQTACFFGKFT